MPISYDSLELNISANVSQASRGIRALKNNLQALQNTVKGLDFGLIENLQKHLQDIANIDFSNVSKGLRDVVSAFKSFNQQAGRKNGKLEDRPYEPNFTMQDSQLPTIFEPNFEMKDTLELTLQGWNDFKEAIEEPINDENIIEVEAHFKTLEGELERAGFSYEQIKEIMRSTNAEAKLFSEEGIEQARNILQNFGYTADEVDRIVERLKTDVEKAGENAKKSSKGWDKIVSAFKRILFYRVVRRAIQLIAQAIKEGIQNLAQFDSGFNESMSNIKSSLSYFKNSLGTIIAPLIKVIEPLITTLLDGLSEIANMLGEVFAGLSGQDTFTEAVKGAEDYAESLKKVKNQALGIDELNVMSKDENEPQYQTNQVSTQISSGLGQIIEGIKSVFKNFFTSLKQIIEPLTGILSSVFGIVGDLVEKVAPVFNSILSSVLELLGSVLGVIDFLLQALSPIFDVLEKGVQLFAELLGTGIAIAVEIIADVLELISPVIQSIGNIIKWLFGKKDEGGSGLGDYMEDIINGMMNLISWVMGIFEILRSRFKSAWKKAVKNISTDVSQNGVARYTNAGGATSSALSMLWDALFGKQDESSGYATGGFPEDGFFYANHNELVGQFSNGRTAVANNEQITEGIYRAVLQAMNESAGTRNNGNIVLKIDGKEIAKTVDKYNAQKGADMIKGGYGYGN